MVNKAPEDSSIGTASPPVFQSTPETDPAIKSSGEIHEERGENSHFGIPLGPYAWMIAGSFSFTWMGIWTFALSQSAADGELARDWRVIAFFRSLIAFFGAVVCCALRGGRFIVIRPSMIWLRSIAGSASMVCTFYALTRLPTPEVLTLTNTYPLWIGLFAGWFLGEWPGWGTFLAAIIGILGVGLVLQPHNENSPLAISSALAASGFTAVAMLGLNRLKGNDNWAIVAHFSAVAMATCLVMLLPQGNWLGQLWNTVSSKQGWMLVGVGVGALLGQWCLTQAFTRGVAARVSIVGLSQVVFGLVIDTLLFDRTWNQLTLLGMFMVLLPTAWVMSRRKS